MRERERGRIRAAELTCSKSSRIRRGSGSFLLLFGSRMVGVEVCFLG